MHQKLPLIFILFSCIKAEEGIGKRLLDNLRVLDGYQVNLNSLVMVILERRFEKIIVENEKSKATILKKLEQIKSTEENIDFDNNAVKSNDLNPIEQKKSAEKTKIQILEEWLRNCKNQNEKTAKYSKYYDFNKNKFTILMMEKHFYDNLKESINDANKNEIRTIFNEFITFIEDNKKIILDEEVERANDQSNTWIKLIDKAKALVKSANQYIPSFVLEKSKDEKIIAVCDKYIDFVYKIDVIKNTNSKDFLIFKTIELLRIILEITESKRREVISVLKERMENKELFISSLNEFFKVLIAVLEKKVLQNIKIAKQSYNHSSLLFDAASIKTLLINYINFGVKDLDYNFEEFFFTCFHNNEIDEQIEQLTKLIKLKF